MAYANGQIPKSALVPVQSGLYLTPLAAQSWQQVVKGVQDRYGWTPRLTDAYRDLYGDYGQIAIFLSRYQPSYIQYAPGKVDVRYWNGKPYWRKPNTAAAAVPGKSNHGWGTAVDVTGLGQYGSVKYRQFADVAEELGWSNDEGMLVKEPWHWTKNSLSYANNPNQSPGVPNLPDPNPYPNPDPISPEDDMTEDEHKALLAVAAAVQDIKNSLTGPVGPPYTDADMPFGQNITASIATAREALQKLLDAAALQAGVPAAVQALLDAPKGDVDEQALAAALAPLLGAITDADLARIAKTTMDEQDRRARARLG